jgi:formylglycine-generating enzyme required for sulfatase activity
MSNDPAAIVSKPRPLRVFLCHSSADKPAVRELYQRLKADDFEPWLDEEDLLPGQDWQREIPKAVRESDVVIVCLSRGSVNRAGYIQKEIKFALDVADEQPEGAIFIIPVKLEDCKVPDRLNRWQWVNQFDPNGYKKLLRALQFRAKSLPATIAAQSEELVAPRPQSNETSQSNSVVSNQSGGVDLKANDVAVGQDVTGRDKVVSAGGHIIHAEAGATVVINERSTVLPAEQPASNARDVERAERLAREQAEQERLAQEKIKAEQLAAQKAEAARIAKEKAEQERLAREKAEAERLAKQKAEAARIAKEKAEQERLARKKAEAARIAKEKADQERLAREKAEADRFARQKAEAERAARKKAVQEQQALKRAAAVAAFNQQLRKIFTRDRILVGLIALGVLDVYIIVSVAISGNNAASISATLTPTNTNTPTPTFTLTPTEPTDTPTPAPTSTRGPTNTPTPTPLPTMIPVTPVTQVSAKDGMTLLYVSAREFTMGSNDGDSDEKPQHTVYLGAFWIDQTEVTNAMYAKCVKASACQAPSSTKSVTHDSYYGNAQFDSYPVVNVSWNDATAYCQWAGRDLPTEAQWEKAARGDDQRTYPWGLETPEANRLNFNRNVGDTTTVGKYPEGASPYGALDMAGNVWEWVADRHGSYPSSPSSNPTGPTSGDTRVLRGGSWYYGASYVRASSRVGVDPGDRDVSIGFRCAR